jgi:hypothetical protein
MNKEEILATKNWSSEYPYYAEMAECEILDAMDEYAKQECIGFAEWVAINGWYLNKIKRWSNRDDNSNSLVEVLAGSKSTEELYTLFLNTKIPPIEHE